MCDGLACLQVSPAGEILETLMDPEGSHISYISSATEYDGRLFFGNVMGKYVSYVYL